MCPSALVQSVEGRVPCRGFPILPHRTTSAVGLVVSSSADPPPAQEARPVNNISSMVHLAVFYRLCEGLPCTLMRLMLLEAPSHDSFAETAPAKAVFCKRHRWYIGVHTHKD